MHLRLPTLGAVLLLALVTGCPATSTTGEGTSSSSSSGAASGSSSGGADAGRLDAGQGDAGSPDAGGGGGSDAGVDAGPQPCSPALALTAPRTGVLPLDLLTFSATGGTGAYRFSLTRNLSGGIINELTGAYVSGPTPGRVLSGGMREKDEVTVMDNGCTGSASMEVTVVPPMTVRPATAEIRPNTQFDFQVVDGLGPFTFELVSGSAGGTVSSTGHYSVGTGQGRDIVRVTDTGGGSFVDAVLNVVAGAVLAPQQGTVFLPAGSTFRPVIRGGSGHVTATVTGGAVTFSNGMINAVTPGTSSLAITDEFSGQQTTLTAVVTAPQVAPTTRAGDQTSVAWPAAPGDVTGDGRPDALLGMIEVDFVGVDSGGVYLYASDATTGLRATPLHVYAPRARREQFGRQVVTADLDGDTVQDLLVAAPLADVGAGDNGGVYVYYGATVTTDAGVTLPWPEQPDTILAGRNGGDQAGTSVAVCDFNDDGMLDVAVGAVLAEDTTASPQASNQGGVFVYLGTATGFAGSADLVLWGSLPDTAGTWAGSRDLRIGNALAAGDYDGDGACDLAVGTLQYRLDSNASNDGAVFLYKGVAATSTTGGGLQPLPSAAWAGDNTGDRGSNLGRYLAMGDVTGDGKADLVVSQYLHDKVAGQTNNQGAVRIFQGKALPTMPPTALSLPETADWTAEGVNNGDNFGWYVVVADVGGDATADVLASALSGDGPPDAGVNNQGSVTAFHGVNGSLPPTTPSATWAGEANGDRFAQQFAVLGDVDNDGTKDLLSLAARRDDYGLDVGTPVYVPGDRNRTPLKLEMPSASGGQQLGRGLDIVGDVNGDGNADLVVGSPLDDITAGAAVNAGQAFLYLGTAAGFATTPALTITGFTGHGGGDQLGYGVTRAGDFDGDGIPDFAVLARNDDRPSTFPAASYVQDGSCATTRNDSGAVFVFRGSASGLPSTTPAFVYYGPQASQVIETVAGGVDVNNDGRDDLVLGSPTWDDGGTSDTGGVAVVLGRAADTGGLIKVICTEDLLWLGLSAGANVGRSVAAVGDINGDGCDEVAVGANAEDLDSGNTDRGVVRVLLGWGGTGCPTSATAVTVIGPSNGAQAGYSVAGGGDVDGDGTPDLAVGAVGLRNNNNTTGGAWMVPGAYLASLTARALAQTAPANAAPVVDPGRMGVFVVLGDVAGERAGQAVDLVPGAGGGGRAAMAVGGPLGQYSGVLLTGGVRVHRFETTGNIGFTAPPIATLGGETRAGGRVGELVKGGRQGSRSVVVAGAYEASGVSLDQGTAYVMMLP